jgi:DNA/RNA endonuclease YhcR with UshA esterase domain
MRPFAAGAATLAIVFFVCAVLQPAAAHHSFAAEFDVNQPVTLHGTVTGMEWINPHAWLHIEVKNDDGTTTAWMIEGATPNTLFRRGFTRDSVKAGMEITVEGYRSRNGANRANGRDLILPDGSRLFMGSPPGAGAPGDDPTAAEE